MLRLIFRQIMLTGHHEKGNTNESVATGWIEARLVVDPIDWTAL